MDTSFSTPVPVLGIMLKDWMPVTVNSLFAFAKISLLHRRYRSARAVASVSSR